MNILSGKKNFILPVRNILLVCLAILLFSGQRPYPVERDELSLSAGLDLFPSLVAADLDITAKKGKEGTVTLLLFYTDNRARALSMLKTLGELKTIRSIPIRIEVSNDLTMSEYA
ncbi:MAG: hypothetical protein GX846_03575, partial [Deltaproteobacteria bacterium]|nr:hypothetical protein [Deltaproteobacteria bacterium]